MLIEQLIMRGVDIATSNIFMIPPKEAVCAPLIRHRQISLRAVLSMHMHTRS